MNTLSPLKSLHKWKETAKAYGKGEEEESLKRSNKILLERLWNVTEGRNNHKRRNTVDNFLSIHHRALSQKKL